jgi:hypothetical protein
MQNGEHKQQPLQSYKSFPLPHNCFQVMGPQVVQHFHLPTKLSSVDGPIEPNFHSQLAILGQQNFTLL